MTVWQDPETEPAKYNPAIIHVTNSLIHVNLFFGKKKRNRCSSITDLFNLSNHFLTRLFSCTSCFFEPCKPFFHFCLHACFDYLQLTSSCLFDRIKSFAFSLPESCLSQWAITVVLQFTVSVFIFFDLSPALTGGLTLLLKEKYKSEWMGCKDEQNWVRRIQTRGCCDLDLCQSPHRDASPRQSVDAEWDFRFCTGLKWSPLCVYAAPRGARMCLMWRLPANRVFLRPPVRPCERIVALLLESSSPFSGNPPR